MTIIIIDPPPPPPRPKSFTGTDAEWAEFHAEVWRSCCLRIQAQLPAITRIKAWWKSRTLKFNALVGVVLTAAIAYTGDLREALGAYGPAAVVVLGVGNAVFRFVTDARLSR